MSFRDQFRRGLLTNVFLHARLEQRDAGDSAAMKRELRRPGLAKHLILANVRKMRKLVARLDWSSGTRVLYFATPRTVISSN
jgi:hypothetical protein